MPPHGYCKLCEKVKNMEHRERLEGLYTTVSQDAAISEARALGYDVSRKAMDTHMKHLGITPATAMIPLVQGEIVDMNSAGQVWDVTTSQGNVTTSDDDRIKVTLEAIIRAGIDKIASGAALVSTTHVLQALEQYSNRYGKQNTDRIDQLAALLRGNVEEVTLKLREDSHANNTLETFCQVEDAKVTGGDKSIDNGPNNSDSFSL